jgi:hypothetical protein
MIVSSELRIGNWVYEGIKEPLQISLGNDDLWHTQNFDPIPLTPEILAKCGFKNGNNEVANCDLWNKYWLGDFELDNNGNDFDYETTSIKYVHQLQNLYFAIVQKELDVTL